jgi:signal peptidase I
LTTTLHKLWKKEAFKTVIVIGLIPILVACVWFGMPKALNTEIYPVFAVISGSMCIPPNECDAFSHVFEKTLHVGDLIVIQGVDANDLKTSYPNSDIIVFRNPQVAVNDSHANIVHRIIDVVEVNGKLYFYTKGDGNGYPNVWPQTPTQSKDNWTSSAEDPTSTYKGAISEDYVYGKVVMRIPWIGSIVIFLQQNNIIQIGLFAIIVIVIIVGFIIPLIKNKTTNTTEEPATTQSTIKEADNIVKQFEEEQTAIKEPTMLPDTDEETTYQE